MRVNPQFVTEIFREDLDSFESPSEAVISNVQHLSSYNWVDAPADKPTIVVPGSPPLWTPPKVQVQLAPDQGFYYVSQNAERIPESPLEPLFRALYTAHPEFDISSVNFVSDRINIRKLLAFVDPTSNGKRIESFTVNVEVKADTVMFYRQETVTSEFIEPDTFNGYGHNFRDANTTELVEGSTGHHRIISYDFAGKKFLIRYTVEAFTDDNHIMPVQTEAIAPSAVDDSPTPAGPGSKLLIKNGGKTVSHDSTVEIRTRARHRRFPIKDVASHLWVSQTPNLVRAAYVEGTFRDPVVKNIAADIQAWEVKFQGKLRKLSGLLNHIALLVKSYDNTGKGSSSFKLEYDASKDTLVLWKVGVEKKMLPQDLYDKWHGQESMDGDSLGAQATDTLADNMEKTAVSKKDE